jgi:hypothetical protein
MWGIRIGGLGFEGTGFEIWDLGCSVWGSGFRD